MREDSIEYDEDYGQYHTSPKCNYQCKEDR